MVGTKNGVTIELFYFFHTFLFKLQCELISGHDIVCSKYLRVYL